MYVERNDKKRERKEQIIMKKKFVRMLSLAMAMLMIVGSMAGCGNKEAAADPQASTEEAVSNETEEAAEVEDINETGKLKLMWEQNIGIDTMFVNPWNDRQTQHVFAIYESLLGDHPQDDEVVGVLATGYEVSEDGLTYTLPLREGVKWHDGEEVTVEDVLFSLNGIVANPTSAYKGNLYLVEGYQDVLDGKAETLSGVSVEGNNIIIKLSSADPLFPRYLSNVAILPAHCFEGVSYADIDSYEEFWSKPIGTGQYVIDEVSFPDYFTAVRNENYWGEKAKIKTIEFVAYDAGGADATSAALIAGGIDFAMGGTIDDITVAKSMMEQNPDLEYSLQANVSYRMFVFNLGTRSDGNNKADLLKDEVRQAFDLMIDKEMMASYYSGQATAISTFCHPDNPQYNDDIPLPKKDLETAKKMLEEAGFDFSQTIDLAYYYSDQTTIDIMEVIKADFASIGVKLNPILLTGDTNNLIYVESNFDLLYCKNGGVNPCDTYQSLRPSTGYTFLGDDEKRAEIWEDLVTSYKTATDSVERKKYADELQALDYQYRYAIPAYVLDTVVVYNAANVSIPEGFLTYAGCNHYSWEDWSLVQK